MALSVTIGVALYGDDISPRFCFAPRLLVAETEDGRIVREDTVGLGQASLVGRLTLLGHLGVGVLLCGGFNARFRAVAEAMGITVVPGLMGPAHEALDAYVRGQPLPVSPWGPRRGGRCRRRGGGTYSD